MRVAVQFRDDRAEFEVGEDRVAGIWQGPPGLPPADLDRSLAEVLVEPLDYPPLQRGVVPGDRVVIAWDADIPEGPVILRTVVDRLLAGGVDAESIHVLADRPPASECSYLLPDGVTGSVHDPDDDRQLAYLASTPQGRRIYLNRRLTDADIVVPVGLLGYDPVLGYRGPWGVIFPGLSNAETLRAYRAQAVESPPDAEHDRAALSESADVSWLLGSQFQVALLPGASGPSGAIAGLGTSVRAEGRRRLDAEWAFRADRRAGVVVAGIGPPGRPTRLDDLAEGLATATRLVRRGGKIVALSRAEGPLGAAWQRLSATEEPGAGPPSLRGLEGEPDYPSARQLAAALAWADVYLFSSLPEGEAEDLSMIPLGRPEEARRLIETGDSCLFVSQADRTRAELLDDD